MQVKPQRPQNVSGNPSNRHPSSRASHLLQALVITGSLAATGMGALLISRMETIKSDVTGDEVTSVGSESVALQPIPTIMVPPTVSAVTSVQATSEPVTQSEQPVQLIPTDTPVPTATLQPTATPVVSQQSSAGQSLVTPRVQRRSRSSR